MKLEGDKYVKKQKKIKIQNGKNGNAKNKKGGVYKNEQKK